MSCVYPSCQMGGGGCPYEKDCDAEHASAVSASEEKRKLDIEEQRLRIAKLRRELGEQ